MQTIYTDTSNAAQRARLLDRLRTGPVSTFEARKNLEIMHPAGRIKELKDQGHKIEKLWVQEETETGVLHRIALYVLTGGEA
ncbi:helix-turn-helix domain-containing protein [Uliginosibacterium sp. TH139]|uniref:helix-turn-helix domain-containing protein n=1 Tax=Uliginosibacterium sp. TH139 TaxID=2067453 RepID=UPI000C7A287C|nr:helix-turn-helix domain-containing protein [Uliginosibacterium sp. TH139]PLK47039.1 hypothetical protein C0V76_18445 [Uliginosibacterium sp. TH139]